MPFSLSSLPSPLPHSHLQLATLLTSLILLLLTPTPSQVSSLRLILAASRAAEAEHSMRAERLQNELLAASAAVASGEGKEGGSVRWKKGGGRHIPCGLSGFRSSSSRHPQRQHQARGGRGGGERQEAQGDRKEGCVRGGLHLGEPAARHISLPRIPSGGAVAAVAVAATSAPAEGTAAATLLAISSPSPLSKCAMPALLPPGGAVAAVAAAATSALAEGTAAAAVAITDGREAEARLRAQLAAQAEELEVLRAEVAAEALARSHAKVEGEEQNIELLSQIASMESAVAAAATAAAAVVAVGPPQRGNVAEDGAGVDAAAKVQEEEGQLRGRAQESERRAAELERSRDEYAQRAEVRGCLEGGPTGCRASALGGGGLLASLHTLIL